MKMETKLYKQDEILQNFLELTAYTVPHYVKGAYNYPIKFLPQGIQQDEFGNFFIEIGKSDIMFTCHLDTCCNEINKVNHIVNGNFVLTDGTSILGADDKAGMLVLLKMIECGVEGLYYFFLGEEVGSGHSKAVADSMDVSQYDKCISFDRRGTNSIITAQGGEACASKEFVKSLSELFNNFDNELVLERDDTGIFTDSKCFIGEITECTNISVGYYYEHTVNEYQDIKYLTKLINACCNIDWSKVRHSLEHFMFNETLKIKDKNKKVKTIKFNEDVVDEEFKLICKNIKTVREKSDRFKWNGYFLYFRDDKDRHHIYLNRNDINFLKPINNTLYYEI